MERRREGGMEGGREGGRENGREVGRREEGLAVGWMGWVREQLIWKSGRQLTRYRLP